MQDTLTMLPDSNAVNQILGVAQKLRDVAIAHTQTLCVREEARGEE